MSVHYPHRCAGCFGAMPSARAAAASRWSLQAVSSTAGIAIAVFAALYFAGQLVRGVL